MLKFWVDRERIPRPAFFLDLIQAQALTKYQDIVLLIATVCTILHQYNLVHQLLLLSSNLRPKQPFPLTKHIFKAWADYDQNRAHFCLYTNSPFATHQVKLK